MTEEELMLKYRHAPEEFPVLMEQTHKIIRDKKTINERININENLIHYIQDTALLISKIDGRLEGGKPYDHIVYLDKSARPVSWLINMFWEEFANKQGDSVIPRPPHSYINIDRAPWFRNVGINVSDDGRQKENGELATYKDFVNNIHNLDPRHLAEIRALYIPGGIEKEDADWISSQPTILDGKRIIIVDEVSRTGSTLEIAKHIFRLAFPNADVIEGAYFWNPSEPLLMMGSETVLTSLPVWYDPNTLIGRGIGGTDRHYYRNLYERYLEDYKTNTNININKFRTYAFSSSVYSAPLFDNDGNVLNLAKEQRTRSLCKDLLRLYDEFKAGHIFFQPPSEWTDFDEFESIIENQGVKLLPWQASEDERERVRKSPLFYLNFLSKLKES